jgi:hypothetical protein
MNGIMAQEDRLTLASTIESVLASGDGVAGYCMIGVRHDMAPGLIALLREGQGDQGWDTLAGARSADFYSQVSPGDVIDDIRVGALSAGFSEDAVEETVARLLRWRAVAQARLAEKDIGLPPDGQSTASYQAADGDRRFIEARAHQRSPEAREKARRRCAKASLDLRQSPGEDSSLLERSFVRLVSYVGNVPMSRICASRLDGVDPAVLKSIGSAFQRACGDLSPAYTIDTLEIGGTPKDPELLVTVVPNKQASY